MPITYYRLSERACADTQNVFGSGKDDNSKHFCNTNTLKEENKPLNGRRFERPDCMLH